MTMDEIENTSISAWKEKVKTQTNINALLYLNSNLGSKSQKHTEFKMSSFPHVVLTYEFCHMANDPCIF